MLNVGFRSDSIRKKKSLFKNEFISLLKTNIPKKNKIQMMLRLQKVQKRKRFQEKR